MFVHSLPCKKISFSLIYILPMSIQIFINLCAFQSPSWHPPLPLPPHVLRRAAARALRHGLEVVATGIIGSAQAALTAHAPVEDAEQPEDHEKTSRSSSRPRSTRSNRSSSISSVARYQAAKASLFPVEEASRKLAEGLNSRPMFKAPTLMFSTARQPLHVWVSATNDQASPPSSAATHHTSSHHRMDTSAMKLCWAVVTLESMERAAAASKRAAHATGGYHSSLAGSGYGPDDSVFMSQVVRIERLGRGPAAMQAMAQATVANSSSSSSRLLGPYSPSSFSTGIEPSPATSTTTPFGIAVYASLKGQSTRSGVFESSDASKAKEQTQTAPSETPKDSTAIVEDESNHSEENGEVLVLKFECGSEAERDAVADGLDLLCSGLKW